MDDRNSIGRGTRRWGWTSLFLALAISTTARGQGPTIDADNPPGIGRGISRLGDSPGASGTSSFSNTPGAQDSPISGRVGPSVSRAPSSVTGPSTTTRRIEGGPHFKIRQIPTANIPSYGDLELPPQDVAVGIAGGLTIDQAIDALLQQNLSIMALKYELPMADADILTAGLRANPIFYADTQLVPYGRYSRVNPGGQTQYDVNITHPLDVNGKRKARTNVARAARRTVEAQFQDAVRQQIDNLYTVYVDVAAAELTRAFSQAYLKGISDILQVSRRLYTEKQYTEAQVDQVASQAEEAKIQVRESEMAVARATKALAQMLNVPRSEALSIRIDSKLRDVHESPQGEDDLIRTSLDYRPDLIAYRLGVERARTEYLLARKERLSDFYLLAQPYTLQDNRPFGLKSPMSWAVGLTAPLPIYNRNQGNIERARLNITQTGIELADLERKVADEVADAFHEFETSRRAVIDFEHEVLPSARRVKDAAFNRWKGGKTSVIEFLDAQKDFNERVRAYRDALVRHRRAMLDLNTAVGMRVLP
jgi:cobalt-zinc-cadmium efflux system outer membrane protein